MRLPPLVLLRVQQRPQLVRDRLARAVNARAHGADRATHGLRYVFVAHALELAYLDGAPHLFGQLLDRGVDGARDLVREQDALGGVDIAQLLAFIEAFRLFGLHLGRGRRPPTQGHEVILGRVDADPVQPGVERAVAAKRRQCPVRLDERFLRHVLDFRRIADEARQQPSQLTLILLHQQAKCLLVAALRPLDQLPVDFAVRHLTAYVPQTPALGNSSRPGRAIAQFDSCTPATGGTLPHSAQSLSRRNPSGSSMSAVTSRVRREGGRRGRVTPPPPAKGPPPPPAAKCPPPGPPHPPPPRGVAPLVAAPA